MKRRLLYFMYGMAIRRRIQFAGRLRRIVIYVILWHEEHVLQHALRQKEVGRIIFFSPVHS